ncbi:branched-chain amino acid ABC transporter permease [Serratia marcescens]|nr:branched-chain amino acid ABC transporter permease [Serratia marcescens]
MDTLVQQTVNGLMLGSIYALIALGYTMVYGILRIINFAHGDVLMIGALSALSAIGVLQHHFPALPPYATLLLAALFAMSVCAITSMAIERLAYRRLRTAPRLAPLISGIGVSLLLQTLAMLIWSRNPLMFPQLLPMTPIALTAGSAEHAPAVITGTAIVTLAVAVAVMAGLWLLVEHSRFGRAMRATAENPQVAGLMGISPDRIIVLTFALGGALAAVAGIMMASNYGNAGFSMGFLPGIKAFRTGMRHLPAPERAPASTGRAAFGRRAADGGDGPRAAQPPAPVDIGRTVDGAGADCGGGHFFGHQTVGP